MLSFVLFVDFSVPEDATGKQMKRTVTLSKLIDSSGFNVVGNIWELNKIDKFCLDILMQNSYTLKLSDEPHVSVVPLNNNTTSVSDKLKKELTFS